MRVDLVKWLCDQGAQNAANSINSCDQDTKTKYIAQLLQSVADYQKLVDACIISIQHDGIFVGAKWTLHDAGIGNGYNVGDIIEITNVDEDGYVSIDDLFGVNIEGLMEIAKWEGK